MLVMGIKKSAQVKPEPILEKYS